VNDGQFEVPDDVVGRLNELDNEAVAAVEAGDEARFHELFDQMQQLHEEIWLDYLLCAPLSHSSFLMFTEKVLPRLL
jgi:hypothetical protein